MNYERRDPMGMYKDTANLSQGADARPGPGPVLMGADALVGNSVCNRNSDDLGDIKEIMLDMRTGRVSYAVLAFGGFLGEKLFAVPWEALQLDTGNKRFVLDVDRARLQSAPGFDKNHWPDMADATWAKPYGDQSHV